MIVFIINVDFSCVNKLIFENREKITMISFKKKKTIMSIRLPHSFIYIIEYMQIIYIFCYIVRKEIDTHITMIDRP